MAFRQTKPDHFPYNALRVYFDSNNVGVYYYKGEGAPPQKNQLKYLAEEAETLLKEVGRQWVKAEIILVEGIEFNDISTINVLYNQNN
ncbi:hypothetical protein GCM10027341_55840 [Spirosoma knui]